MSRDEMRRYGERVQEAVARTFMAHGLACHIYGAVQGPHTWTIGLRLQEATDANLRKALKLARAVEAEVRDGPVRIYDTRGTIYVEVPSPRPVVIPGRRLMGSGLHVPLGMTARRGLVGIDFRRDPHLLIVGPTGRGKTTAARALIYHLARQNSSRRVALAVVTFKPHDWRTADRLPHTMDVIHRPEIAEKMLSWARREMQRRTTRGIQEPHIFLVLDDLLNLLALVNAADVLAEIASLGRGAGIHLVVGTQRLGKRGAGDAAVTGNMPVRLVFGTADAQDAAAFTGRSGSGAEGLGRYPGDALLVAHGEVRRLAVSPVSDRDLGELAQKFQNGSVHTPLDSPRTEVQNYAEPAVLGGSIGSVAVPTGSVGSAEVPLLPKRRPHPPHETDLICRVYQELGGNKTQTCIRVWGYKNGETWAWLEEALAQGGLA